MEISVNQNSAMSIPVTYGQGQNIGNSTTYKYHRLYRDYDAACTLFVEEKTANDQSTDVAWHFAPGIGIEQHDTIKAKGSSTWSLACNGIVDVENVTEEVYDTTTSLVAVFRVKNSGKEDKLIHVPIESIQDGSKDLKKILIKAGIIFASTKGYTELVSDLLGTIYRKEPQKVFKALTLDDDGQIKCERSEEYLRESAAPQEIKGWLVTEGRKLVMNVLDFMTDIAIMAISHIVGISLPMMVYTSHNSYEVGQELAEALGTEFIPLEQFKLESSPPGIILVDATSASEYKIKTVFPQLQKLSSKTCVVVVANRASDLPMSDAIICPYTQLKNIQPRKLRCTVCAMIIKHPEIINRVREELEGTSFDEFGSGLAEAAKAKTAIARVMLESITDDADIRTREYAEYLEENYGLTGKSATQLLRMWLDSREPEYRHRLFINKEDAKRNVVMIDAQNIYFSSNCLSEIAEAMGQNVTAFARSLRAEGALVSDDRLQKAFSVKNDETVRGYVVKLTSLYEFGEIRAAIDDHLGDSVNTLVPFAKCKGSSIFIPYGGIFDGQNHNIIILGDSGTGKSYAARNIAAAHARTGINVVVLNLPGAELSIPGAECVHISCSKLMEPSTVTVGELVEAYLTHNEIAINERIEYMRGNSTKFDNISSALDYMRKTYEDFEEIDPICNWLEEASEKCELLLSFDPERICRPGKISEILCEENESIVDVVMRTLFDYKSKHNNTPTLLIIDEAHRLNLGKDSVLKNLLVRQGRKHNLHTLAITQYLSCEDGVYMKKFIDQFDLKIIFRPNDDINLLKKIGIKPSDKEIREAILGMPRYTAIAKGFMASDKGMVDYPLFLTFAE